MTQNLANNHNDDLFFQTIVNAYVSNPRFLARPWLEAEVVQHLADPACRFVLLTAKPGFGKSVFMAQLAHDHPDWPRYFIRRDQRSPLATVDARSFLLRVGYQLAACYPELFNEEQIQIAVEQRIGSIQQGGEAVGAEVKRILASPFHSQVIRIQQEVQQVSGRLTGLRVDELVIEPRLLDTADLLNMALIDPAIALLRVQPDQQIVILIDALDEIRYHEIEDNILKWLTNCPALPSNIRFVLSSRPPDTALQVFCEKQQSRLRSLEIDAASTQVHNDVSLYVNRLITQPAVATVLPGQPNAGTEFTRQLKDKANGNLGYLDALARAIDSAFLHQDSETLTALLDLRLLPSDLNDLHGFFLRQVKAAVERQRIEMVDRETGENYDKPAWPTLYHRILGVLAVALEPLTEKQIIILGRIEVAESYVSGAIERLRQFLDVVTGNRYYLYHTSLAEFLTADATYNQSGASTIYINSKHWHQQIAINLWNNYHLDWSRCDDYGLRYVSTHFLSAQEFDRVEQILTSLTFIKAKCLAGLLDDLLRDFEIFRRVLSTRWDEKRSIAQFSYFVSHTAHLLRVSPELAYQEAFNSVQQHVHQAAVDILSGDGFSIASWLRKSAGTIRQQHSGQAISMVFWGEERYLVVSTSEREVWIWDTVLGRIWRRCETPPSAAKSLVVSPNGEFLAAGFGAPDPSPLISGVIVWTREGKIVWIHQMENWVYTLRWRNDDKLIIGAGLPDGSEAVGTLWQASITQRSCEEIGRYLADRPMVLTWDPLPGQSDQIMALSMDGIVYHLTPDYIPFTDDELHAIEVQLLSSYEDIDTYYSTRDALFAERRPILHQVSAPSVDKSGFHAVLQTFGQNQICMLGEPPVPPELFAWHTPNPDGIYIFDFEQKSSFNLPFNEEVRSAGLVATCLTALSSEQCIAIGTSVGQVYTFSLKEDNFIPELVHQGRFPVTSVCFSQSGEHIAVGDANAQLAVCDRVKRSLVFGTKQAERPVAARAKDSQVFLLYSNRLELFSGNSNEANEVILFTQDLWALDFDCYDNLAVILSSSTPGEETDTRRYIQIIDLTVRRVVLWLEIPSRGPTMLDGKMTSEASLSIRNIRLYVDDASCQIILGSAHGLITYPFLAFENGRTFVLPKSAVEREREMTVLRIGQDVPEISCEVFAIAFEKFAVICGYADNADHPNISGEIRVWNLLTGEYSVSQQFSSSIRSIESTSDGTFIVGTEHGEASAWHFDGEWHRLAGVRHSVAVVAVAYAEARQLACSASRDGLLMVWHFLSDTPLLKTYVDVEPVFVGFLHQGQRLCMVDRGGEVHVWEIEGYDKLPHNDYPIKKKQSTEYAAKLVRQLIEGATQVSRIQELYARGEQDTAKLLFDTLTDMPNAREIQQYWQMRLSR